jgi:hypothetical protein
MHLSIKFFSLLLLLFTLGSCSPKLHETATGEKLPRRKLTELTAALDSLSGTRPHYFYTKIKCEYSDTTQHRSFKTSIRMVRDSAVNALITFASIPIVNSLIRPDSVTVTNRNDHCFIKRDLNFIKEQFGIAFDYRNIEELFLGLPIGYDSTQKYFQIHDPYNYIISSHKKREIRRETRMRTERDRNNDRLRREDRHPEENNEEEEVILNYYLSDDIRTIKRVFISSPNDTTSITIDYVSRDSVETSLVPNEVSVVIVTPRNRLVMSMDYDKSSIDVPVDIHFVIPEEYEECKQEE